jgi:hypothetical protein
VNLTRVCVLNSCLAWRKRTLTPSACTPAQSVSRPSPRVNAGAWPSIARRRANRRPIANVSMPAGATSLASGNEFGSQGRPAAWSARQAVTHTLSLPRLTRSDGVCTAAWKGKSARRWGSRHWPLVAILRKRRCYPLQLVKPIPFGLHCVVGVLPRSMLHRTVAV